MTDQHQPDWICCQLGAREHYATPRALHRARRLDRLITDAWVTSSSQWLTGRLALARLGQRHHRELASARVESFTASLLFHEAWWQVTGTAGWARVMARNEWFQATAAAALPRSADRKIVFAHSYTAEAIFRVAKERGWTTVLGQIDPGPEHFAVLRALDARHPDFALPGGDPPQRYFDQWRRECGLSDHIVVNSRWSRDALCKSGIDAGRILVVPIAYEPDVDGPASTRSFPSSFSPARPLRVLYVGTVSVGKGIAELLQAFEALRGEPVELTLVGALAMKVPGHYRHQPNIRFVGPVDRRTVMDYYQSADVLVFPTHSDGFGMAQVEAHAWGLPIIASRHCGEVVKDGETGILLDEVSAASLAGAVRRLLNSPILLEQFSRAIAPASVDAGAALIGAVQQ